MRLAMDHFLAVLGIFKTLAETITHEIMDQILTTDKAYVYYSILLMHAQNVSANCLGSECDTGLCASYGGTSVCYCPAGQSCDGECSGDSTSLLNGNQSCIGELLMTKYMHMKILLSNFHFH